VNEKSRPPACAPVRLAPVFKPRIWGSRNLAPLYPRLPQVPDPIGEAWLTGNSCKFDTGAFAGRTLGEVWPELSAVWTGTRLRNLPAMPLLGKFIFTQDRLSVQVHPDDAYAEMHEKQSGGVGKTEMWYVASAQRNAELRVGFCPGVTSEIVRRAIADGSIEGYLQPLRVHEGDAIFVPAGTPHTIGLGLVLCEIQQQSDLTYRIFDYHRVDADGQPRQLHIRQALDVMRIEERAGGLCDPVTVRHGPFTKTIFAACRYFAVERWEFGEPTAAATSSEHFELLIILRGSGRIEHENGSEPYAAAEAWLLPAALGGYALAPGSPTTLLRAYVPDLQEFARSLSDERVPEAEWSRVVHP